MPKFQKGQSGNPGGRPKGHDEVRELARTHTAAAVSKLAEWMASDNPKASVSACVALLDRGWGRPAQALTDADGESLSLIPAGAMLQFVASIIPGSENRT